MKIAIVGYSGSGKSTLARLLGDHYGIPVLHFDRVHWMPGWVARDREETGRIVGRFMDENQDWVIDGTYSRQHFDRRMGEADRIVILTFHRFACLWRVFKRRCTRRDGCRPCVAEGCPEKVDGEFVRWILWKGRGRKQRELFRSLVQRYPEKCTVIRNQRQLTAFCRGYAAELTVQKKAPS